MSDTVVLNDEAKQVSSTIVSYNPDVIADRLVVFSEIVTNIKLYAYQKEFAYRLAYSLVVNDGEEITALWSRQTGKTEGVSVIIVGAMILLPVLADMFTQLEHYKRGLWVGVFAPIMEQANTMYERICSRIHSEVAEEILTDPDIQTRVVGHGAKLENGSHVRVMSASKQSNIESKSFHIVIVDECQDVSEFKMLKSIHPMIAAYNGTIVKIGTPNGQKCEFLDAINRNKRRDLNVVNRCYRNHYEFDYLVCQESNPKYKKFIEREIERFGEDGDYFRMAYRLHWMIEIGVFITEEKLDQCLNKSYDLVKEDHESVCVFGLDIGKSNDSTVCAVLALDVDNPDENGFYKKRVLNWLELSGEDYEAQFWQIFDFLNDYKILRGCVDKTAVGDPIADRLYAQFESREVEIVPITFSTQTKSQMYKYLLQEIQASRLIVPGCRAAIKTRRYTKFRQQMVDLEKSWKGQYMVVSHPSARNSHDDYCLSEDTEILTDRGFVSMEGMSMKDRVTCWNDDSLIYDYPSRIIRKEYSGKMIHFNGVHFECLVTPEHKMICKMRTNRKNVGKDIQVVVSCQAKDFLSLSESTIVSKRSFPVSGVQNLPDLDSLTDNDVKLMGWMITEGWICQSKKKGWNDHRYMLAQSKKIYPDKVEEIEDVIRGLDYNVYDRKDGVRIWQFRKKSKSVFDRLLGYEIHRIPRDFLSFASARQLTILYDTMMKGDGTISRQTYSTASVMLAEDFQELCHRIGKGAIIASVKNKALYSVYILKSKYRCVHKLEEVDYSGKVWCVTVPTGYIVIRYNGKIGVVGNCDAMALAIWAGSEIFLREIDVYKGEIFHNREANPLFSRRADRTIFGKRRTG